MWWVEFLGAVVAVVWALGVGVAAGVLWERERLLNPDGAREVRWLGALVLCALLWPLVRVLWGPSRSSTPQPPPGVDTEAEQLPPLGPGLVHVPSSPVAGQPPDGFLLGRVVEQPPSLRKGFAVADPTLLSGLTASQTLVGQRVYVQSLALVLERQGSVWRSVECSCCYNNSGFPVVLCRGHRSDVDLHGEPDEDEGAVGR